MFDILYHLFFRKPEPKKMPASNNWDGVPKPDLTWDEVSRKTQYITPLIPGTQEIMPEFCPECGVVLRRYQSAWEDMDPDNGGQYMVSGCYCPIGHWTHLDWA